MDFSFLFKYAGYFARGAGVTIYLSFFTVLFGTFLGFILALMKLSPIKPLKWFASGYVEFIRGTPLLVQVLIIYYGLPMFTPWDLPDKVAGILALSINSAAYMAEIFRAGIENIDKGQTEAARSLGMSKSLTMRLIILPQAIKNILPALGNEFIVVIKESSIVMFIGISELMYNAQIVKSKTFQAFEPFFFAALVYFVITFSLSRLLARFERRLKVSD
ncbi:MAG: amino acid ABC transporter permease [Gorillibacterium sp.]|nr:amino acid ABC transporter permease [Gorillibacterium sp.]